MLDRLNNSAPSYFKPKPPALVQRPPALPSNPYRQVAPTPISYNRVIDPGGSGSAPAHPSPNPPNPPQPPPPGGGGGPSPGGGNPYDYSGDPILAQVIAARDDALRQRRGADLAEKRRLLLGFGSKSLAQSILGNDDMTLGAISDDPDASTSTLAQLAYGYRNAKRDLIENVNPQNLFFSGHHAMEQEKLSRAKLMDEANAESNLRNLLFQLTQGGLSFEDMWRQRVLAEEGNAYGRSISRAGSSNATGASGFSNNALGIPTGGSLGPNYAGFDPAAEEALRAFIASRNKSKPAAPSLSIGHTDRF